MEYVVIKKFTDKEDKHHYTVGDRYPYRGFAKKERIDELASSANKRKEPMIMAKDAEKPVEKKEAKPKRSNKK